MNPPNENEFSSGFEVGDLVLASGLPQLCLAELINGNSTENVTAGTLSSANVSLPYQICDGQEKYRIIAFGDGAGAEALSKLSSTLEAITKKETLEANQSEFEFVKYRGQEFSINEEALSLFRSLKQDENLFLKCSEKMESKKTLIITGYSRGGWVASLLCLWLLQNQKSDPASLPICITFGSPLLGDEGFSKAVQVRSLWKSRILNVVSYGDLIPRTFLPEKIYKPFGTYLVCSSTGCSCFDDPVSVLQVLESAGPSPMPNSLMDYENLLKHLTHQMILSNSIAVSQLWTTSDHNPLKAGLTLQLEAIGVERTQRDAFIEKMVDQESKNYKNNMWFIYDSERKLNECKMDMANLEWYKKTCSSKERRMGGYYDCFKNKEHKMDIAIVKYKKSISKYWEEVVRRAVTIPPMRHLEASITHLRMIEPLEIAEFYSKGNTDYRNKGRPNHFKVLEDWQEKKQKHNKSTAANTLTEDSCFWADVEEAMILTNSMKANLEAGGSEPAGESINIANLSKFEKDVMGLIVRKAVSPDIFLKESTFMKWWNAYVTIPLPIRDANSPLSEYMNEGRYHQYS